MLKNMTRIYKNEGKKILYIHNIILIFLLSIFILGSLFSPIWLIRLAKNKIIEMEFLNGLFTTWLLIVGSIAGGAITLLGVLITILNQKNSEIKNQKNMFKPYLKVKGNSKISSHLGKKAVELELTNVGRGELYLSELYLSAKYSWDNEKFLMDYNQYEKGEHVIAPNDSMRIYCHIFDDEGKRQNVRFNIYVKALYYDLFLDKVIEQKETVLRLRALFDYNVVINDDNYYVGYEKDNLDVLK